MARDADIPEDLRATLAHMAWQYNPTGRVDLDTMPAKLNARPTLADDRQCKGVDITKQSLRTEARNILLIACRFDATFPGEVIGSWSGEIDGRHIIEVWAKGAALPVLPEPANPMAD